MSKLSIKMFIKREIRGGKTYVYRMVLSFKTSVTVDFFVTSRRTPVSVVEQFSSDITWFFAKHCLMSGANIQAWLWQKKGVLSITETFSKTLKFGNHRIPHFIFCRRFDDEQKINYEWPNKEPRGISTIIVPLELKSL